MNDERPWWRDTEPEAFATAVGVAASELGVLPLAVEKDYWACEALRAITVTHPGEVVFKGGTSLEKLRMIRRFSEDLDLLVIGAYESGRAADASPLGREAREPASQRLPCSSNHSLSDVRGNRRRDGRTS